jgi:hypothetical protein
VLDVSTAISLQDQYLAGNKRMLSALYCEVSRLVDSVLNKRALDEQERTDIAHDVASRLCARYLRPEGYRVQSFRRTIWLECKHRVTDGGHQERPGKQIEKKMLPIEAILDVEAKDRNGHEDTTYSLQDILSDHAMGYQIVIDIYRSRSYREAMERVAVYATRRWMLDHCVRLKYVYKHTRRRHANIRS